MRVSGVRMRRREKSSGRVLRHVGIACAAMLAFGGCGTTTEILKTASLPALPTLPASAPVTSVSSTHSEGTHEIYTRVARGAKACWFGPGKPLVENYVFEGEVAPEADGGAAEVAVHIRTPDQPSPRGGKVFIVTITKVADGASLVTESRRIPDTMAGSLSADVARWAKTGSVECGKIEMPESVAASQGPPLPERKPVRPVKGKRAK